MRRTLLYGLVLIIVPLLGFLGSNSTVDYSFNLPFFGVKVPSTNHWKSILVGRWRFQNKFKAHGATGERTGIIVFKSDCSYSFHLISKLFYIGSENLTNKVVSQSFQGTINGKWTVLDSSINLFSLDCILPVTKNTIGYDDLKPCELLDTMNFGFFTNDYIESRIKKFSKNRIEFETIAFDAEVVETTIFVRQD